MTAMMWMIINLIMHTKQSKGVAFKRIKSGGHEMAAMMLMIINFINALLLKFITIIHIIAAISWPPPLISQLFHPGFLKVKLFGC